MEMIEGWGLWPPKKNADWFSYVVLGEPKGCKNSRCSHFSHDPAAPVAAWVPREGVKILGWVRGPLHGNDRFEEYFAATNGSEVRFFRYIKVFGYWARIEQVDPGDVPPDIKSRLLP